MLTFQQQVSTKDAFGVTYCRWLSFSGVAIAARLRLQQTSATISIFAAISAFAELVSGYIDLVGSCY